jgi:hypothetical protein
VSDEPLEQLRVAAERQWGAERAAALEDVLRRMAAALFTVERFPVPFAEEPFPTGPETHRA